MNKNLQIPKNQLHQLKSAWKSKNHSLWNKGLPVKKVHFDKTSGLKKRLKNKEKKQIVCSSFPIQHTFPPPCVIKPHLLWELTSFWQKETSQYQRIWVVFFVGFFSNLCFGSFTLTLLSTPVHSCVHFHLNETSCIGFAEFQQARKETSLNSPLP